MKEKVPTTKTITTCDACGEKHEEKTNKCVMCGKDLCNHLQCAPTITITDWNKPRQQPEEKYCTVCHPCKDKVKDFIKNKGEVKP